MDRGRGGGGYAQVVLHLLTLLLVLAPRIIRPIAREDLPDDVADHRKPDADENPDERQEDDEEAPHVARKVLAEEKRNRPQVSRKAQGETPEIATKTAGRRGGTHEVVRSKLDQLGRIDRRQPRCVLVDAHNNEQQPKLPRRNPRQDERAKHGVGTFAEAEVLEHLCCWEEDVDHVQQDEDDDPASSTDQGFVSTWLQDGKNRNERRRRRRTYPTWVMLTR